MKKSLSFLVALLIISIIMSFSSVGCKAPVEEAIPTEEETTPAEEEKMLTYGYITPGPDTWYKRDVEGFEYGASLDGVEVIVVNSDYDVEKELANIDYLINEGVDGICVFSFNENGARIAAERGLEAGIPVVATDSVGSVKKAGVDIVAEIDFDWTTMGETYAEWMAENHPGEDFVVITGNFESVPMIRINEAIEGKSEELGKNKMLDIREGEFNPEKAVNVAQDYLQSGLDFTIMFVTDEDMAAAVIRMMEGQGVLNNPYIIISENGSPAGLPLIKEGKLKFTISSSPGWEGYIAYLALHNDVIGAMDEINQQIYLPIMPISEDNIDDPTKVVPWEITPDVYEALTKEYFPELVTYRE